MKNKLATVAGVALVLGVGVYLARAPLWNMAADKLTSDMFIESDSDSFDPGLAVGEHFPPIAALYRGDEIHSVEQFVSDKGMIFIANRSADW